VLDSDSVLAARREILARLETVDEVAPDSDGIFTGRSRRAEREPDLGAFWKSVSEGPPSPGGLARPLDRPDRGRRRR
jgi:hypothetical protein